MFENLRCALLWSMGYRYSFWTPLWRQRELNEKTARMLEELNLTSRSDTPAGLLSYADQRALEIGMTIAGGASVILLDEPTAGMSNTETDNAVELIRRVSKDKTLVMVEHDMKVVFDLADVITVLVYGQVIASGPPAGRARQSGGAGSLSGCAGGMILEVENLHAYYGQSHILHGVDLNVGDGEIVSLLGPQRRRPLDRLQGDHGAGAGAGHDPVPQQGYRGPAARPGRALRHRLCAGGSPDLSDADGAAKSRARPETRRPHSAAGNSTTSIACFRT